MPSILHTLYSHLYQKDTKIIYLIIIISIRSHSRKWSWRDWQPLYHVGWEVLICLCRYEGLACSLLLDWYIGSQKLREILTLLCCITLSSSRENQRSAQEVARRISGIVAGESTHKSRHTKYPSQTLIPRITLFAICLSFSSPPLHPCRFIRPLFPFPFSFLVRLFSLASCVLVCWIVCHDGSR